MAYLARRRISRDGRGELTCVCVGEGKRVEAGTPFCDLMTHASILQQKKRSIGHTLNQLAPLPSQLAAVLGAFPR
jgi:hypothetical protein